MNADSDDDLQALKWRCRSRGMLELDALLTAFLEKQYGSLPDHLKSEFQSLLDAEDQILFSCFFNESKPPPKISEALIALIKQISAIR